MADNNHAFSSSFKVSNSFSSKAIALCFYVTVAKNIKK